MSADFYTRAKGFIFETEQPRIKKSIGYDSLPEFIKNSTVFSANNLGKFASAEIIPSETELNLFIRQMEKESLENFESSKEAFYRYKEQNDFRKMLKAALILMQENHPDRKKFLELTAKCALENNDIDFAWIAAIFAGKIK